MSFLRLVAVGFVGNDAEMRFTPSGVAVTSFNVAVDQSYKNRDGEKVAKTTWLRVTCWRESAESAAQYIKKGSCVMVEADDVQANAYTTRRGEAAASLEITARSWRFVGRKPENAAETTENTQNDDIFNEDAPF